MQKKSQETVTVPPEKEQNKEVYVSPELKKFPPIRVSTGYTYYYYYYSYSYSS